MNLIKTRRLEISVYIGDHHKFAWWRQKARVYKHGFVARFSRLGFTLRYGKDNTVKHPRYESRKEKLLRLAREAGVRLDAAVINGVFYVDFESQTAGRTVRDPNGTPATIVELGPASMDETIRLILANKNVALNAADELATILGGTWPHRSMGLDVEHMNKVFDAKFAEEPEAPKKTTEEIIIGKQEFAKLYPNAEDRIHRMGSTHNGPTYDAGGGVVVNKLPSLIDPAKLRMETKSGPGGVQKIKETRMPPVGVDFVGKAGDL